MNTSHHHSRGAWARALIVLAIALWAVPPVSPNSQAAPDQSWSVENPGGPTKPLEFTATEGTWISVDVSPDGRNIAFDLLGHIYEMPVGGGDARRLTEGRSWNLSPRYSPDGTRLAFTSDRNGQHDVWVLERQSGKLQNLSNASQNVSRPSWAPDGRRLFAGTTAGLTAYGLRGESTVVIENRSGLASVAPGGTHLYLEQSRPLYPFEFNPYVIVNSGARIERHDLQSGETEVYIERPGGAFNPAVSPDGRTLAYLHRDIDDTALVLHDLQTREERIVLRALEPDRQEGGGYSGPYANMAWHPDSKQVFVSFGGGIHGVNAATGQATRVPVRAPVRRELTETLRYPTTLPDKVSRTRSHRWASRTPSGVLHEALGDLWLGDGAGARNLTNSEAHETSPVWDPTTETVYYASWADDEHGSVYALRSRSGERERLTTIPSQYGSLALSPDGNVLAYVRGTGGLQRGLWLSNETRFELVVRESGRERVVTTVSGRELQYANFAAKIPPNVQFGPDGRTLYFTEFVEDALVLKRVGLDGGDERVLYRFPHAAEAALSPDLQWIALREYHRSFITPFQVSGSAIAVSAFDQQGFTLRVDAEDGGYFTWSRDGKTLGWTRAAAFYEKDIADIVKEDERSGLTAGEQPASAEQWRGPRVPGSTARRIDLAREFALDEPKTSVAFTGVRVITMNPQRSILENATVVIQGHKIAAIGTGVKIPAEARVFNLAGHTIMPGLVDAHAHPHIDHSALHVIEQRPPYFHGALAYGVTTMMEVYGNEFRDGWMSDMLMAGKITGPRLFTTGSPIYGSRQGRVRMYRPFDTIAGAREQLRWNKDHGAIAVKDYAQSTRKRRHLTAMAARDLGLNVLSESSGNPQMNLTQIMDGVTGIEHSMGLASFYDDMVRFWSGSKAGMTPTLIVAYGGRMGEGWMHQRERLWEDKKLTKFILPEHLMRLRRTTHMPPEDYWARTMASALRKLYAAGTSLHVGAHGQLLGLDTHWELEILTEGGFSAAQALEMGTIKGATHLGLDRAIGSLEPGKLADLIVLRENPLQDIKQTKSIRYVVKNGVVYDGEDAARVYPNPRPAGSMYFRPRSGATSTSTAGSAIAAAPPQRKP